jgi:hypothetical protein
MSPQLIKHDASRVQAVRRRPASTAECEQPRRVLFAEDFAVQLGDIAFLVDEARVSGKSQFP